MHIKIIIMFIQLIYLYDHLSTLLLGRLRETKPYVWEKYWHLARSTSNICFTICLNRFEISVMTAFKPYMHVRCDSIFLSPFLPIDLNRTVWRRCWEIWRTNPLNMLICPFKCTYAWWSWPEGWRTNRINTLLWSHMMLLNWSEISILKKAKWKNLL